MSKIDANDLARTLGPDGLGAELDILTAKPAVTNKDRNGHLVTPTLIRASDVPPEAVEWLWHPYVPRGKLTMLQGNPGEGKTFLALSLAAIVSRGWPLPGPDGKPGEEREPESVLYLSMEDGIADTLRPRLDAQGADLDRVYFLESFLRTHSRTNEQTEEGISFQEVEALRASFEKVRPALMVADPIQGFIGRDVDLHRANEVRPVLAGLSRLAQEFRCAVVCLAHLRKGDAEKALFRGLGSIDIVAAARSVLLAGRDPDNPRDRAILHIKSSLAPEGPAMGYNISEGRFEWTGLSELTTAKFFASDSATRGPSALERAIKFLKEALIAGSVLAEEITDRAQDLGISKSSLARAKSELNVKSCRQSDGNDGAGDWLWQLPSQSQGDQVYV